MTEHNIKLTAGDLSVLWNSYVSDTMAICVFRYFQEKVEDTQIKALVDYALELSLSHVHTVSKIFKSEDIQIPMGFTDKDVNIQAPRLFSDVFILQYIKNMARLAMVTYSLALYIAARTDVREYYNECMASTVELDNKSTELLLEKGLYVRAATIPNPKQVEFVQKQSFLAGWIGERRPLLAVEITQIYANIVTNSLGKALMMGFSQVAQSEDIRNYFIRGKAIADKHVEVFSGIMRDEDLPVPAFWDSEVTASTTPPFSEKLMMFHVTSLTALGIADYGTSISVSPRKDLATHLHRLMAEIELYGEDGANLLIKHGWMEQPPQNANRNQLVGK